CRTGRATRCGCATTPSGAASSSWWATSRPSWSRSSSRTSTRRCWRTSSARPTPTAPCGASITPPYSAVRCEAEMETGTDHPVAPWLARERQLHQALAEAWRSCAAAIRPHAELCAQFTREVLNPFLTAEEAARAAGADEPDWPGWWLMQARALDRWRRVHAQV